MHVCVNSIVSFTDIIDPSLSFPNVHPQTSHQTRLNMGPLLFHIRVINSQGDMHHLGLHKNLGSLNASHVSRHIFVFLLASQAIHNIILFSKCRGSRFPIMDCRKPPKMHIAAEIIIPHKCPLTPADQTEICNGSISDNKPDIFKHFLQYFIWQVDV